MASKEFILNLLEQEVEDFIQTQAEKVITFEDDPMAYILKKYPSLNDTLTDLMTKHFGDYVMGIYVMAPKPTTFKVLLHNGQFFYLMYAKDSYIAKIQGKKYYLLDLGAEEYATKAIADLLTMGKPPGAEGPDDQEDNITVTDTETETDVDITDDGGSDEEDLSEAKNEEEFKPHMMYDPKTGEGKYAKVKDDHLKLKAKGWGHDKPKRVANKKKIRIIKESLLKESSESYDEVIRRGLGLDENEDIPLNKGTYSLQESTFEFNVAPDDMDNFNKLYGLAPPKVGKKEGQTKGVGNGEIALYYLFQFQRSSINVEDGRGNDSPDLIINGKGVEVKSYKSHTGLIKLGRFGADRENLYLLSNIFGLYTLTQSFDGGESPSINPTNWKASMLPTALKSVYDFIGIENYDNLVKTYPQVFGAIDKNITTILRFLGSPKNAEDAAIKTAFRVVDAKLNRKPGYDGYLANVKESGNIRFFKIDKSALEGEELLNNLGVAQSTIQLNFDNLFS